MSKNAELVCPWRAEALIIAVSEHENAGAILLCLKEKCAMWGSYETTEERYNSGDGGWIHSTVVKQGCMRRG